MRSPRRRHVMGASRGHGCVGAFYALRAGKGNQILQINCFKSVEKIRGYSSAVVPYSCPVMPGARRPRDPHDVRTSFTSVRNRAGAPR